MKLLPLASLLFSLGLSSLCLAEVPPALTKPDFQKEADGTVQITSAQKDKVIRYTIDGTDPGPKSGPYLAPITLPAGGVIKARNFSPDRKSQSELAEITLPNDKGATPVPSTLIPCTQDRDWPIYDWALRHNQVCQQMQTKNPEVVFIGDSITQMFGGEPHDRKQPGKEVWEKHYAPLRAVNLGFGYDYVENTLWRLQNGALKGGKPKVAVLLIGTNNMGKNTPEEIHLGVQAVIKEIRTQLPETKIILMGILPRGAKPDGMRNKVLKTNELLQKLDGKDQITYLDITEKLLQPDGTLTREIMGDYLHPTQAGYEIWTAAMDETLRKLLAQP